ncbi:hypothetical protein GOV06_00885 [Candidatus Woesearchaeota archaeon]|nr:hypothetical protein [Candidatus Woesearchaeota archaeon]
MIAATSAIVKEENQTSGCIYCGAKLKLNWRYTIIDGIEYKVTECENNHRAAIRINRHLSIDQFSKIHAMDH